MDSSLPGDWSLSFSDNKCSSSNTGSGVDNVSSNNTEFVIFKTSLTEILFSLDHLITIFSPIISVVRMRHLGYWNMGAS
jgi:hypothetical protein